MNYPFAALVGLDQLKTALLVNAVYPQIGGVLIRGEKGTAKSTAARALAELLPAIETVKGCPFQCEYQSRWADCPHCGVVETEVETRAAPFVELPLGATEDRVIGTLDFEKALRESRRAFQPGLLAQAHRGVLYIDEVNLLADHLVDALLDTAASGVNTVAREGVSVAHPARFLLIGTMNPEEGDLRPQLLDRFGLMVEIAGPREPAVRADVVRRRLDFEKDPAAFSEHWRQEQQQLAGRIVAARAQLPAVQLDDGMLTLITRLCCEFDVDGLRADIALHKTARALAALAARAEVTAEDVRQAAELVLPHRRRRRPFEQPGLDQNQLQAFFDNPPPPPDQAATDDDAGEEVSGRAREREEVFEPGRPHAWQRLEIESKQRADAGKRSRGSTGTGRYVRAAPDPDTDDPALEATIRAAAMRRAETRAAGPLTLERRDLQRKEREGRTGTLIYFVVDSSGSMAARRRMELVKGAVLGLLGEAYVCRDEVGVIAFRGVEAELLLPATSSVELAERALRALPTGGRTPLAHALQLLRDAIGLHARDGRPVLAVLLTDGKANVPLPGSRGDPWQQALAAARELAALRLPAVVVDSAAGFVASDRTAVLAAALNAEQRPLAEASADELIACVHAVR